MQYFNLDVFHPVLAAAKTCVFWEIEECPIPSGLNPESVAENIRSALARKGYHGEVTIKAYGDKYQIKEYFQSAGIEIQHHGNKVERVIGMITDFYAWVFRNDMRSTNMMVISGDISDYESCLQSFIAQNQNILLAQPEHAPIFPSRMFVPNK